MEDSLALENLTKSLITLFGLCDNLSEYISILNSSTFDGVFIVLSICFMKIRWIWIQYNLHLLNYFKMFVPVLIHSSKSMRFVFNFYL